MRKGFFVTGTDLGVGKTVIAAGIAGAMAQLGKNVGVMKPVATGATMIDGKLASREAIYLQKVSGATDDLALINPFLYESAAPPSLAAIWEKREEVDLKLLEDRYFELTLLHEIVIVDGEGGLMAPLNNDETTLDLALQLGCELIVVARPSRGTISHTLLTVNLARNMGLHVAGIVLNGYGRGKMGMVERSNPDEIRRFAPVPMLGIIPWLDGVDLDTLSTTGLVETVLDRLDLDPLIRDDDPDWSIDML